MSWKKLTKSFSKYTPHLFLLLLGVVYFEIEIRPGSRSFWGSAPVLSKAIPSSVDQENRKRDVQPQLRILLVADPQILGENKESYIFRWDADRFLHRFYRQAIQQVIPDVIIFMGDIFDEGNCADDEQFRRYLKRFRDIFNLPQDVSDTSDYTYVFLPGDNDVGEELNDIVLQPKMLERFEDAFGPKDETVIPIRHPLNYRLLRLIKFNLLKDGNNVSWVNSLDDTLHLKNHIRPFIILSHMPLLRLNGNKTFPGVTELIHRLRPPLIISSHTHISYQYWFRKKPFFGNLSRLFMKESWTERLVRLVKGRKLPSYFYTSDADSITFNLNPKEYGLTQEILVPTCSYRMGRTNTGYGALIIHGNGTAQYTVLWIPDRITPCRIVFFASLYVFVWLFRRYIVLALQRTIFFLSFYVSVFLPRRIWAERRGFRYRPEFISRCR